MILLFIFILGLIFGSFANASVWRIYKQSQNSQNKAAKKYSITRGRSICENCQHVLAPSDLIPLASWLALGGKCRYCKKPISILDPFVEVLTAFLFSISYIFWPLDLHGIGLFYFIFWLLFVAGFVSLIVYDFKWQRLPNRITYLLVILAVVQLIASLVFFKTGYHALYEAMWGVLISSGIFYVLLIISNGMWIGGGDVKLGIVIGLLVGGPMMSLLMLLLSSLLGTLYSLPLLVIGKASRDTKVPFGPFLIIATIIVRLFGVSIINYYQRLFY